MRTSDFLNTSEGAKYLLCDGSEIPSAYTKLRTLMTHTPDLRDRVPQGTGAYSVNTTIEAGLPNIYGNSWDRNYRYFVVTDGTYLNKLTFGSLLFDVNYHIRIGGGLGSYGLSVFSFNASSYNSIYKDECNTVQPPALAVNFYIKAK